MKTAIYAIVASLAASTAMAGGYAKPIVQTMPVAPVQVAAPKAPALGWGNYFFGVQHGVGDTEFDGPGAAAAVFGDYKASGVHFGYQRNLGGTILGGEIAYDLIRPEDEMQADLFRARAKMGYDAGRFMPYVTLGVAHFDFDVAGRNDTTNGITYGVGMDYRLADVDRGAFSVGAEYSRFAWSDVAEESLGTGVDLESGLFQLRVTYRY